MFPLIRAGESGGFSEMSDAYSFGVFLLELVTGEAAPNMILSGHESLIQWVNILLPNTFMQSTSYDSSCYFPVIHITRCNTIYYQQLDRLKFYTFHLQKL